MASKYWIKLYHEILHDPKMGQLPDRLWRRVIELFLLAGENGDDGSLPSESDMSWTLRTDYAEFTKDLDELLEIGIVCERDGKYYVTNFAKRQAPVPDSERMQAYRERKRQEQYYGDDGVTKRNEQRNEQSDDTLVEPEPDTEEESSDDVFPTGEREKTAKPELKPFLTTGDPIQDMVVSSRLAKERSVPDWAIPDGDGTHPFFAVVAAFCELTLQEPSLLTPKVGKQWLTKYERISSEAGLSSEAMLQAHEFLDDEKRGGWYLEHHKWTTPYSDSYEEQLIMAALQVKAGTITRVDGWSRALE